MALRKTHKRVTHKRVTHKRVTHKRVTHKRVTHKRVTHKRKIRGGVYPRTSNEISNAYEELKQKTKSMTIDNYEEIHSEVRALHNEARNIGNSKLAQKIQGYEYGVINQEIKKLHYKNKGGFINTSLCSDDIENNFEYLKDQLSQQTTDTIEDFIGQVRYFYDEAKRTGASESCLAKIEAFENNEVSDKMEELIS